MLCELVLDDTIRKMGRLEYVHAITKEWSYE